MQRIWESFKLSSKKVLNPKCITDLTVLLKHKCTIARKSLGDHGISKIKKFLLAQLHATELLQHIALVERAHLQHARLQRKKYSLRHQLVPNLLLVTVHCQPLCQLENSHGGSSFFSRVPYGILCITA